MRRSPPPANSRMRYAVAGPWICCRNRMMLGWENVECRCDSFRSRWMSVWLAGSGEGIALIAMCVWVLRDFPT